MRVVAAFLVVVMGAAQVRAGCPVECDGSGDAIAIQTAIDTLPVGGGVVEIAPGFCLVENPIRIERGGITLRSGGWKGALLMLSPGVDDDLLVIGDGVAYVTGTRIEGLALIGNSNNQSAGSGIHLKRAEDTHLNGLFVTDFKDSGIWAEGGPGGNTVYVHVSDSYVHTNAGRGIDVTGTAYAAIVRGNVIAGNGKGTGLPGFQATGNSEHVVTGNLFDENGMGLRLYSSSWVVVSSNTFLNTERHAVLMDGGSHHNTVSGNAVLSPSNGSPDVYSGIVTDGTHNSLANNSVWGRENRLDSGIRELPGADHNAVSGNVLHNAVHPLLVLGADTVVSGNVLD